MQRPLLGMACTPISLTSYVSHKVLNVIAFSSSVQVVEEDSTHPSVLLARWNVEVSVAPLLELGVQLQRSGTDPPHVSGLRT